MFFLLFCLSYYLCLSIVLSIILSSVYFSVWSIHVSIHWFVHVSAALYPDEGSRRVVYYTWEWYPSIQRNNSYYWQALYSCSYRVFKQQHGGKAVQPVSQAADLIISNERRTAPTSTPSNVDVLMSQVLLKDHRGDFQRGWQVQSIPVSGWCEWSPLALFFCISPLNPSIENFFSLSAAELWSPVACQRSRSTYSVCSNQHSHRQIQRWKSYVHAEWSKLPLYAFCLKWKKL